MPADIHTTLIDLCNQVGHAPDILPPIPLKEWPEGSEEYRLLSTFAAMAEQVRQRLQQLQETEQELREREEQYRSIFETSYDGLFIHDLDGLLVEVNPSFCRMFGYTREELIGQHASLLTAPASLANLSEALDIHKAGGEFHQLGIGSAQGWHHLSSRCP
jgi:PAS domain-containing protein